MNTYEKVVPPNASIVITSPRGIMSWSVTELHSALGLKVRTKALSQAQAETVGAAGL